MENADLAERTTLPIYFRSSSTKKLTSISRNDGHNKTQQASNAPSNTRQSIDAIVPLPPNAPLTLDAKTCKPLKRGLVRQNASSFRRDKANEKHSHPLQEVVMPRPKMSRRSSWYNPKAPWDPSERNDDDDDDDDYEDDDVRRIVPQRSKSANDAALLENVVTLSNLWNSNHRKYDCTVKKSTADDSEDADDSNLDSSQSSWADITVSDSEGDWEECLRHLSITSQHTTTTTTSARGESFACRHSSAVLMKGNSIRSMFSAESARSSLLSGHNYSSDDEDSEAQCQDNDLAFWN